MIEIIMCGNTDFHEKKKKKSFRHTQLFAETQKNIQHISVP